MKKNWLNVFVFTFLLLPFSLTKAQKVEVIDFPGFEERLQRSNDTLYIYNFWATWCRPCVKELPYFTLLDSTFAPQKVKVEFITLDFLDQLEGAVMPLVKRKLPESRVLLLDAPKYNEWIDKVSTEWSGAIPASLFVHKGRDIYTFKQQSFTYEELSSFVKELLQD